MLKTSIVTETVYEYLEETIIKEKSTSTDDFEFQQKNLQPISLDAMDDFQYKAILGVEKKVFQFTCKLVEKDLKEPPKLRYHSYIT